MGESQLERPYDWSQRLWVIARGKLVTARSTVMFKTQAQQFQIARGHRQVIYGCTTSCATGCSNLQLVVARSDQLHDLMTGHATSLPLHIKRCSVKLTACEPVWPSGKALGW